MKIAITALMLATATLTLLSGCASGPLTRANASTASAAGIAADSRAALRSLYAQNPKARQLGQAAKGVLVFPSMYKAGLMVGAQAGNGALLYNNGSIGGFYQSTAASYGLQAGVQNFGYALFLMDDEAFQNLNRTSGWELGSSPSIVILDKGKAGAITSATLNRGTYAFFFNQRGLMAGLGFQGTKITRINPKP
jgi:lipid-binding SYLF domain-containing protein